MSYSSFFTLEFLNLQIKDKRLIKRAIDIGYAFIRSPGSCIQEVFDCCHQTRCAYDFFSNVKVKWLQLLKAHQDCTVDRIKQDHSFIYLIQDNTFYNYTSHKAKMDLGVIGKQGRYTQLGFLQHTALAISAEDLCLGILELTPIMDKEKIYKAKNLGTD